MNKTKLSLFILALTVAGAAQAEDTFKIRRTYKEGEVLTYNMATSTDTTVDISAFGQGEQKTTMEQSGKMSFKTTKVRADKNEADLEVKFFDLVSKIEGGMPGMGETPPKEYSVFATMDNLNRVKDMRIEGLSGMMKMFNQSSVRQSLGGVTFPENEVKVGDSWDMTVPKDGVVFDTDQTIKVKFVAVKEIAGHKALEFSSKGPLNVNIDLAKIMEQGGGDNPMAGMKMMVTGKMDIDTTVTIDAATGQVLIIDSKLSQDMTVEMVDMGVKLPMSGMTTSIIKSVDLK